MGRRPKPESQKIAEIARSSVFMDAALRRAVGRLARKNPEVARILIGEVQDLREEKKRFLKMDNEKEWLDMAGISALAIVESLENEIRAGKNERHEHALAAVQPEMIREEMESVPAVALGLVQEIGERSRKIAELVRANEEALQRLAPLLQ